MKGLLRNTIINAVSLAFIAEFLPGVTILGGIKTFVISGFILSLLLLVVKPILNLFSLPLNMVTLGLFSFFTNSILLYILTVLVTEVSISAFSFNGFTFAGFVVPVMNFSTLWAFVVTAAILSFVINFFEWLIKK